MNKITKTLSVLLTALMVSLSTSVYSFEGFSVGASYSSMDFNTTGSEVTHGAVGNGALVKNSTTKTGSGDLGSFFAEYTFAQGTTLGVSFIDGSAELGTGSRVETGQTSGTVTQKAEVSDPMTFYVEPTFMMTDTFGVYVKGGATTVSVEPKETADAGNVVTSTYKSQDVWGITTGVGAKFYMGNFFAKAEYMETDYETYHHQSTTGNLNSVSADIDTEETIFAIGYNF
jgi:hypothetical protein